MFPAGSSTNRLFLTVDTPDDLLLMQELWDNYSRLPRLLRAAPAAYPNDSGYIYDNASNRYISAKTRRVVTDPQLRNAVRRVSTEAEKRAKKLTNQLIAGGIILSVWYYRTRSLLKALYKTVWLLGIGGFLFDDNAQRDLFYAFILVQFGFLDNFALQLENGEQALNGLAISRAGMYAEYGNAEWQNIGLSEAILAGKSEGKRILGDNEDHCTDAGRPNAERPGCIELAALGWVPIEQVVPIGDALCLSHCHCRIIFR